MKKIIMALPKGRILNELIPLLQKAEIVPEEEFFRTSSRKLLFKTNQKELSIIKVRSFDVATFVALGAAQIGVAGDDVINEFNYDEIYNFYDLKIGKCRLSVAKIKEKKISDNKGHIVVATKYKNITTNYFAKSISSSCHLILRL